MPRPTPCAPADPWACGAWSERLADRDVEGVAAVRIRVGAPHAVEAHARARADDADRGGVLRREPARDVRVAQAQLPERRRDVARVGERHEVQPVAPELRDVDAQLGREQVLAVAAVRDDVPLVIGGLRRQPPEAEAAVARGAAQAEAARDGALLSIVGPDPAQQAAPREHDAVGERRVEAQLGAELHVVEVAAHGGIALFGAQGQVAAEGRIERAVAQVELRELLDVREPVGILEAEELLAAAAEDVLVDVEEVQILQVPRAAQQETISEEGPIEANLSPWTVVLISLLDAEVVAREAVQRRARAEDVGLRERQIILGGEAAALHARDGRNHDIGGKEAQPQLAQTAQEIAERPLEVATHLLARALGAQPRAQAQLVQLA